MLAFQASYDAPFSGLVEAEEGVKEEELGIFG
jgi:hypothetical protein